jgi:autotransporter-associated beta strand protein
MASGFWKTNGDGNWGTLANWSTTLAGSTQVGSVPGSADTATFSNSNVTVGVGVYLTANRSVSKLVFKNNGAGLNYSSTLSGQATLTLGAGGVDASTLNGWSGFNWDANLTVSANQTWNVGPNGTFFVYGTFAGSSTRVITKTGLGALAMGGLGYSPNSFSGSLVINQGSLLLSGDNCIGSVYSALTIADGITIRNETSSPYSISVGNVIFNGGTVTLGSSNPGFAGPVTIRPSALAYVNNATTTFNVLSDFTINNLVNSSTTTPFTKTGPGTFTTSGGQIWYSPLFVNQGRVILSGCDYFNPAYTSAGISIAANASLMNIDSSIGNISGSGDLYINSRSAYARAKNISNFTGRIIIYADTSSASSIGLESGFGAASQFIFLTDIATFQGMTISGGSTTNSPISIQGNTSSRIVYIDNSGATSTLSGNLTNSSPGIINLKFRCLESSPFTQTKIIEYAGNIGEQSGIGGIINIGISDSIGDTGTRNTVKLSGGNSFRGTVTVGNTTYPNVTLFASSSTALGASTNTSNVIIYPNGTLSLDTAMIYNSRSLLLNGNGSLNDQGALIINNPGTSSFSSTLINTTNTIIRYTNNGHLSGSISLSANTLRVGASANISGGILGVISGTGGLSIASAVADTGTVILGAANLHSGGNTITYGTCKVQNETGLGTGVTVVNFGGRLQASSTTILGKCTAPVLTINGGKLRIGG